METTTDAYDTFDEFLDDAYGDTTIAGMSYSTSRALLALDPIAYRCAFNDWAYDEGLDVDSLEGSLYRH